MYSSGSPEMHRGADSPLSVAAPSHVRASRRNEMNYRKWIMGGLAAWSLAATGALVSVAGPLNPPAGPVAPSYKTLTEVEPRIAVNATNTPGNSAYSYRITQQGSYYLTGDV